jgi:hypothetical protein
MYFNDFVSANKFTQSIGLSGATIKPSTSVRHLNDPTFFTKLGPYLKIDDPQELVAQCNVVSQVVCEAIKQAIGCNAYLTIGDVSSYGKPYFNMDKAYVTDLISGGKQSLYPQKYHHHAWITLDSMEIIDFTISTSLAMISPGLSNNNQTSFSPIDTQTLLITRLHADSHCLRRNTPCLTALLPERGLPAHPVE